MSEYSNETSNISQENNTEQKTSVIDNPGNFVQVNSIKEDNLNTPSPMPAIGGIVTREDF